MAIKSVRVTAAILVAILCRGVSGQVVAGSNIELTLGSIADFGIKTYLNIDRAEGSCGSACTFTYDEFEHQDGTLHVVTPNLSPPVRSYYLMNYGEAFREVDAINFGHLPPIQIGNLGDFYFGIATAFASDIPKNFGWIHLQRSGNDFTMIDNAMAYNNGGIIIGADIAVPEPMGGVATLSWVGALFFKIFQGRGRSGG